MMSVAWCQYVSLLTIYFLVFFSVVDVPLYLFLIFFVFIFILPSVPLWFCPFQHTVTHHCPLHKSHRIMPYHIHMAKTGTIQQQNQCKVRSVRPVFHQHGVWNGSSQYSSWLTYQWHWWVTETTGACRGRSSHESVQGIYLLNISEVLSRLWIDTVGKDYSWEIDVRQTFKISFFPCLSTRVKYYNGSRSNAVRSGQLWSGLEYGSVVVSYECGNGSLGRMKGGEFFYQL